MDLSLRDKQEECERLLRSLSISLGGCLALHLQRELLKSDDVLNLLKFTRDNYQRLAQRGLTEFSEHDCRVAIQIRNTLFHQKPTNTIDLARGIDALKRIQQGFHIKPLRVPLRVLACKFCHTVITRTAQPTQTFSNLGGFVERVARCYDVQVYVLSNVTNEKASRDNTWYPGWVWTMQYCSTCITKGRRTHLGFRFDWAPEDVVNLSVVNLVYDKDRQAMVVVLPNGTKEDLPHVVSDGTVRRHRFAFFERVLEEVSPTLDTTAE